MRLHSFAFFFTSRQKNNLYLCVSLLAQTSVFTLDGWDSAGRGLGRRERGKKKKKKEIKTSQTEETLT